MSAPHELPNIPRKDKVVKRGFGPKLDALAFWDWQAIEYRLLAYYLATIGYDRMVEQFKAGLDPHCAAAADMGLWPGDFADMPDEIRQRGKVGNFSMVYSGGIPTIMRQLGCGPGEAKAFIDRYHASRPELKMLHNPPFKNGQQRGTPGALQRTLAERGYVKTLYGRHLHPDSPHKALNALVQGCAADLCRATLVRMDDWRKQHPDMRSHLISVVHDEIIWDCVEEELPYLEYHIPRLMTDERLEAYLPITAGMAISRTTWADKEDV